MRVLVCGSRHFNDWFTLKKTLDGVGGITEIIEGDARGADRLAGQYARHRGYALREFPADWEKYGKAAGPIRNKQMLDEGKPDMVVAFWDGKSTGTANMILLAFRAGFSEKNGNLKVIKFESNN